MPIAPKKWGLTLAVDADGLGSVPDKTFDVAHVHGVPGEGSTAVGRLEQRRLLPRADAGQLSGDAVPLSYGYVQSCAVASRCA